MSLSRSSVDRILKVSEADLLVRISHIQRLIRELLLPQQRLVAPVEARIQQFVTELYEAIGQGHLLDPPDGGDPLEARWLDWLRDQLSMVVVTLALAPEQTELLAEELLELLRDNPDSDMSRRALVSALIWQRLETVIQALRPREAALLPAVQAELAELSVLLQKVGKLVAKAGRWPLLPDRWVAPGGVLRRRELLFLLESLELAVVALRGEQPDLQVASQLRVDMERLLNRLEFPLGGWFLNRAQDLYRSPSVPLKVVTGLGVSFAISASLISVAMWQALKPTPLEQQFRRQEVQVLELRDRLLGVPGLRMKADGSLEMVGGDESMTGGGLDPLLPSPPITSPGTNPATSPAANPASPAAANPAAADPVSAGDPPLINPVVSSAKGSPVTEGSRAALMERTPDETWVAQAVSEGAGLSLGDFVATVDEYNNRLVTLTTLKQELARAREARQADDELILLVVLVAGAGMMGSVVSILTRISDFDGGTGGDQAVNSAMNRMVHRPLNRAVNRQDLVAELDPLLPIFIGAFKPVIGVSFGLLAFALFSSGIISIGFKEGNGLRDKQFFFSAMAFTIGFSERLAKDVIRRAEGLMGGQGDDA